MKKPSHYIFSLRSSDPVFQMASYFGYREPRLDIILSRIVAALLLALTLSPSGYAASARWSLSPPSSDWNTAANWTPATVPNGQSDIATFDLSVTTDISFSASVQVDSIMFSPEAATYSITVAAPANLSFFGAGIVNSSGANQTLVTKEDIGRQAGIIFFHNNATAGEQMVYVNNPPLNGNLGGQTQFYDTSNAGSSAFLVNGAAHVQFHDNASAGSGVFTVAPSIGLLPPALVSFFDNSTAANSTFTVNGESQDMAIKGEVFFSQQAAAGNGVFTLNGGLAAGSQGGFMEFDLTSTADHGTFVLNGGKADGAEGAELLFMDGSSAGTATFTINGGEVAGAAGGDLTFELKATAGDSTITINPGGQCSFGNTSQGGNARIQVYGTGTLEFSPSSTYELLLGSVEGDGIVTTKDGSEIMIGSNDLSTVFSGSIEGNGLIGKIGTGTLTLSGASTYTGSTTVSAGALVVSNKTGSATGTGSVAVSGGTLGGGGTISGAVTVGTGSGSGAVLQPSYGTNKKITLTIQSELTFKSDGTYNFHLKNKQAEVVANGLTIESGAQFVLVAPKNKLRAGIKTTVISNTSSSPISGTFANLPDGATITSGANTYQANYEGGDGNDLTLTVQ